MAICELEVPPKDFDLAFQFRAPTARHLLRQESVGRFAYRKEHRLPESGEILLPEGTFVDVTAIQSARTCFQFLDGQWGDLISAIGLYEEYRRTACRT